MYGNTSTTDRAARLTWDQWFSLWALTRGAVASLQWGHWMQLWSMLIAASLGLWSWITVVAIIAFDPRASFASESMLVYSIGTLTAIAIHAALFLRRRRKSA